MPPVRPSLFLVPFIDRLRPLVDMREQVVAFPPQPVITRDNVTIDGVALVVRPLGAATAQAT